jgi:hypothetical protein
MPCPPSTADDVAGGPTGMPGDLAAISKSAILQVACTLGE